MNADDWFFILSNRHRRQILRLCSIRPCYPQEIAKILGISPSLVSKHLQELENRKVIVKREETRDEGGRNIQYFYVPFHPRFNFNIANQDLVDIDIVDESEADVPKTHSRKKLIEVESISSEELESTKLKLQDFITLEEERIEVNKKLMSLRGKQREFFRSLHNQSSQKQLLLKIMRFLIDRYGFDSSFSIEDIKEGLGVDNESAIEIVEILGNKINIISNVTPQKDVRESSWKITKNVSNQMHNYH